MRSYLKQEYDFGNVKMEDCDDEGKKVLGTNKFIAEHVWQKRKGKICFPHLKEVLLLDIISILLYGNKVYLVTCKKKNCRP